MPPDETTGSPPRTFSLVSDKPRTDNQDGRELRDLERESLKLRNERDSAQIRNIEADRAMRQTYAARILRYLEIYSGSILILVLLQGFGIRGFSLAAEVMVALVSTTAIAAIGLVGFIARGLFR